MAGAIRRAPRRTVLIVACAIGIWLILAPRDDNRHAAREVLAAVRAWPEDRGDIARDASRRVCKRVNDGVYVDGFGFLGIFDQQRLVLPVSGYDQGTIGAYFGGGSAGVGPTPFLQALMEAGVVRRVSATIVTRIHQPSAGGLAFVPLQDTMAGARPAPPAKQFDDSESRMNADLFVATGEGAAGFVADPVPHDGRIVPRIMPVRNEAGHAVSPTGIVVPAGLCYPLRAERVLEYTDVRTVGYKLREVTVAILMKPKAIPGWASDPRVFDALNDGPILPEDVRILTFRDAGDGWRLYGLTDMREMAGHGHYIDN